MQMDVESFPAMASILNVKKAQKSLMWSLFSSFILVKHIFSVACGVEILFSLLLSYLKFL